MATFLTRREAQERARQEKEQKRANKLRHKDLMWAARRRFLSDEEWYELHMLDRTFGKWGAEQAEYEFGILEEMRDFFKRHEVGSKCPHMNALQRHLAEHSEKEQIKKKQKAKRVANF